jgi:hypothetical protein
MELLYSKDLPSFKIKNTIRYKKLNGEDQNNFEKKENNFFLKKPSKSFKPQKLNLSGSPSTVDTLTTTSLTSRDHKNDSENKIELKLRCISNNRSISYSTSQNVIVKNNSNIPKKNTLNQVKLTNDPLKNSQKEISVLGQKLQPNNSRKAFSIDSKTNNFLNYLENLNPEPKIDNASKKKINILKGQINSIVNAEPMTFRDSTKLEKIKLPSLTETSQNLMKGNQKKKSFFSKNNKSNYSLTGRKGASIIQVEKDKNYEVIIDLFNRICENIRNFEKAVSNEYKAYFLLKSFIKEKQKYLNEFFFVEGKEKMIPNITSAQLEKLSFKKELVTSKCATSLFEEKLINPNLVNDFKELNDKIEDYLIKRYINEMKYLEENIKKNINMNVSAIYKKEDIFISEFNYERMPDESLIDEIYKIEKNFGHLEHFKEKEKIVGKSIDDLIKNAKFLNEQRGYIFKLME